MAWSSVKPGKKLPLKFWCYKLLCEFNYAIGNCSGYYKYLNKIIDMGYNLYGEEFRR